MVIVLTDEQRYAIGTVQYMQDLILNYIRKDPELPISPIKNTRSSMKINRKKYHKQRINVLLHHKELFLEFDSEEDANLVRDFIQSDSCCSELVSKVREVVSKINLKDVELMENPTILGQLVPEVEVTQDYTVVASYFNLNLPETVRKII